MRWLKAIFWAAVLAVVVVFMIQNLQTMNQVVQLSLDLYVKTFTVSIPLYLLIILTFILGVVFGVAYTFKGWLTKAKEVRAKNREIKQLKEELDSLRNLPLTEEKELAATQEEKEEG